MKKLLSAITLLVVIGTTTVDAQTLKSILSDHYEAIGQKKLKKVETLTLNGKLVQSGLEIPFKQITSRPGLFRLEGSFQGLTFIQTYNGKEAWMLNPFTGSTEAEPIPDDQLKSLEIQADLDGMLWDWKEKGSNVTFDKIEDVEGTSCYKVNLITKDTSIYNFFIDVESHLIIKTYSKVKISGQELESEAYFSNYMTVDGMTMPGKIENRYGGEVGEVIVIDSYEFNLPYDKSKFEKPTAE